MLSFEEFEDQLFLQAEEIPDKYFTDLNGGVSAKREMKIHPKSQGEELLVMGEYIEHYALGRLIFLYYGSFVRAYAYRDNEFWKEEIRRVLRHELTHHLEHLAGERDLDIEDAIRLKQYTDHITGSSESDNKTG